MSGSREDNPWYKMLEDYYNNGTPIPFYRPYIPIQWVDVKELDRVIDKSEMKQNYLEHLHDALDKEADESNDNG